MLLLLSTFANSAIGQPVNGTLIGGKDGDTLHYECKEVNAVTVECEFTQILMSKSKQQTIDEPQLEQMVQEFSSETSGYECETMDIIASVIRGEAVSDEKLQSKAIDNIGEIVASVNSDPFGVETLEAFVALCKTPSIKAARNVVEIINMRADVVCDPFANTYSQSFAKVTPDTWVVKSEPSGSCGVVNTSKFVRHADYETLWSYYASKVVTNKNGEGLIDCSELDEGEQPYLWNQAPVFKNCQYFE